MLLKGDPYTVAPWQVTEASEPKVEQEEVAAQAELGVLAGVFFLGVLAGVLPFLCIAEMCE